jgi:hypothetical protein
MKETWWFVQIGGKTKLHGDLDLLLADCPNGALCYTGNGLFSLEHKEERGESLVMGWSLPVVNLLTRIKSR